MDATETIRKLCRTRKMSVTTLEKDLGFSNGSLTKGAAIRSDRLYAVAKYFGVTMEYLLTGERPAADDASPRLSPDEEELLCGYRVASGPVRKIMLDAARDALKGEGGARLSDSFGDVGA